MSLRTGLDIKTMMGAAANSVSRTLDKRMSDFEKEESATRREERAMDYALEKEDALGKRRSERERKKELESYVATINSFLPPEEASKLLAQVTDHSRMGIIASQMTSLANNQINPYDIYKINREAFSPESIKSGTIPYGSLFIPPKKPKEPKYEDSLDKLLAINLQEQFSATNRDEVVRLRSEQERIENLIIRKHGLTNKEASGEEYKPFNKESATSLVKGSYSKDLKQLHGLNENMVDYATKLDIFKKGNELEILSLRFNHAKSLSGQINSIKNTDGWNLAKEPIYTSLVNDFNRETIQKANSIVTRTERDAYYGKTGPNDAFTLIVPENAKKVTTDKNGNVVGYAIDYSKITTTEEEVKANVAKFKYRKGNIVPYIDMSRTKDGVNKINYFIFAEQTGFYNNLNFRQIEN